MSDHTRRRHGDHAGPGPEASPVQRSARAGGGATTRGLPPRPSRDLPPAIPAIQLRAAPGATVDATLDATQRATEPAWAAEPPRDQFSLIAGVDWDATVARRNPGADWDATVQRQGTGGGADAADIQAAAATGVSGPSSPLPHLDAIQQSFGDHDVRGVQAHVGGPAAESAAQMGAQAFATGNQVAFAASPDLHLAAHEAAHVVQQRTGVSLKGGVGQAGDSYEQHADAVADAVVRGESAAPLLAQLAGPGPAAPAVQRLAAVEPGVPAPAAAHIAAPPAIDFGEAIVGEHPKAQAYIFNTHLSAQASVLFELVGAPEFMIVSRPDRLRPSREGPGTPLTIIYQPTKRSVSNAQLTINMTWQLGAIPAEQLTIPVRAKAYAHGEPTHADEDAAKDSAAELAQADAAKADEAAEVKGRVDADNQIDEPYPQGAQNGLQSAYEDAMTSMGLVTDEQRNGINVARDEAQAFQRARPRAADPGILFALAMAGLDIATAGFAGYLAAKVSARMGVKVLAGPAGSVIRGRQVPGVGGAVDNSIRLTARELAAIAAGRATTSGDLNPRELVVMVADGLKQGLKDAGKAARKASFGGAASDAAGPGGGRPRGGDTSSDPLINFFSEQDSVLSWSKAQRLNEVGDARDGLLPLLRQDPAVAAEGMRAMKEGLDEAATRAKDEQANQSRFAWMRFLSQSALGSLDPGEAQAAGLRAGADGQTITDTRDANHAPQEHQPPTRFDGVLDIEFTADFAHPEQPIKVVGASMTGVTPAMAKHLLSVPLQDAGVVIRAHGRADGLANLPITVVRDEAGNLRFTDETAAAGQESNWLARKGGSLVRSPERQLLGARVLMNEILEKQLIDHPMVHQVVNTDNGGKADR